MTLPDDFLIVVIINRLLEDELVEVEKVDSGVTAFEVQEQQAQAIIT